MQKILAKLHAIMEAVDYVQKDKENTFHHYSYASEFAIKQALHDELVKNKVIFTISASNVRREVYASVKGGRAAITDVDIDYTFYDVESGEGLPGKFVGTGDDGADKGTYKAITGAIKYILTSTFLIPTGDDPEADDGGKPEAPRTGKTAPVSNTKPVQPVAPKTNLGNCKDCGAPNRLSQAGKAYCGLRCWLEPKTQPTAPQKVQEPKQEEEVPFHEGFENLPF